MVANHILARILDVDVADVLELKYRCREGHRRTGQVTGSCVCGGPAYHPIPGACRTLGRLMDMAELAQHHKGPT